MTYKEWMMEHYPENIASSYCGGVKGCPDEYECKCSVTGCCTRRADKNCTACWNTEMTAEQVQAANELYAKNHPETVKAEPELTVEEMREKLRSLGAEHIYDNQSGTFEPLEPTQYDKILYEEPSPLKLTRSEILERARACVCGDREQDYGSPESNFKAIADLWNDYLQARGKLSDGLNAIDVSVMQVLLKVARIASGHAKDDNWIDLAGYAACGGEIESRCS